MSINIEKHPLVTIEEAVELLRAVVTNPERYMVVQSEADVGSAKMQTFNEPHVYNKVYVNLTFLDKEKIPSGVDSEMK